MRLLMIDNYDSFTYNLVQLFKEFDLDVTVFRNDKVSLGMIAHVRPDYICISPGPKDPAHAGMSRAVITRFGGSVPILGVCLGMQVIAEVFHGRTKKAPIPVHGKTCLVRHNGIGLFAGLPSPFRVARYHSLCVEIGTPEIEVLARADDGVIMGIRHQHWPICGVQFHPESFMTEWGLELVENFLGLGPAKEGAPASSPDHEDRFPRAGVWASQNVAGDMHVREFSHE